jgi:hypothetical protein
VDEPALEEGLGQLLQEVQRLAGGLVVVEEQLPELATAERLKALSDRVDEYRVRARAEVGQVADVVTAVGQGLDVLLRDQQALADHVRRVVADPGALAPLTEAIQGLRDDLAESHRQLREEARARQVELRDEVLDALDRRLAELTNTGIYDRLGGIEWRMGERLDPLADQLAAIEASVVALRAAPGLATVATTPAAPDPAVVERLAAIEAGVAAFRRDVTGELGQVAHRDDLRRGVDRVLGAVTGAEHADPGARGRDERDRQRPVPGPPGRAVGHTGAG